MDIVGIVGNVKEDIGELGIPICYNARASMVEKNFTVHYGHPKVDSLDVVSYLS